MNTGLKRLIALASMAMLSALAFAAMFFIKIPVVLFLSYEPKDIVLAIGGFLFGPLAAAAMSLVVSLVEMVTVSTTGWIGALMNVLSSCSFVCVAAAVYSKKRTYRSAIIGLALGCVTTTAVMLLWNYLIAPFYMNASREDVAKLLVPAFLPFNLLKSGINAAVTVLVYMPLKKALEVAKLLPKRPDDESRGMGFWGLLLCAVALLGTCVLVILAWRGII